MTNEQKELLKDGINFLYMPFSFKEAIEKHCTWEYSKEDLKSLPKMGKFWNFIKNSNWIKGDSKKITLVQGKDVKIGNLSLIVYGIETAKVYYKNGIREYKLEKSDFRSIMVTNIDVDFDNPITKIQLNFFNNLADPIIVEVETSYYKEPPIDYKKIYLEKMNVNHRIGTDLINIYFQLANDEIDETRIELFVDFNNNLQQMGVFIVSKNMLYHSITNLAPGSYAYNVSQLSKGKEIIKTDNIKFYIARAEFSGRRVVCNR